MICRRVEKLNHQLDDITYSNLSDTSSFWTPDGMDWSYSTESSKRVA
jgi:hypothetical protein